MARPMRAKRPLDDAVARAPLDELQQPHRARIDAVEAMAEAGDDLAVRGDEARRARAPRAGARSAVAARRRRSPHSSSMHCWPAPPCTSSSALIADAIAPLSGRPQVTAMREIAIDGACGPWSTAATSAASSSARLRAASAPRRAASARPSREAERGRSAPGSDSRARAISPGWMSMIAVDHQSLARRRALSLGRVFAACCSYRARLAQGGDLRLASSRARRSISSVCSPSRGGGASTSGSPSRQLEARRATR